jgi:hypothetical protein
MSGRSPQLHVVTSSEQAKELNLFGGVRIAFLLPGYGTFLIGV